LLPAALDALLTETARDVAEHVLDLVAKDDQNYDDNHGDQDEDEGVLYHALPFLTVKQLTEAQIKVGQHAIHLLFDCLQAFGSAFDEPPAIEQAQFHTGPSP
jgi:hypothetical protein